MREIKLENNNGSIRLKFQVDGKRYSLSPVRGGKYGDESSMKRATAIAQIIKSDIESGNFDASLEKYGKKSLREIQTGIDKINQNLKELRQNEAKPDLKELWDKFTFYKSKTLKASTIKVDYNRRVKNAIAELPTTNLNESVLIRDWLIQNKPPRQAKKILTMLSACCDWGIESELLEVNPFSGMAKRVKTPRKNQDDDVNPFTKEERDQIIQGFESSRNYSFYAPLVKFLFFTGCRPSEALALTWKDLKKTKLTINKTFVEGTLQKGTKTEDKRVINLNPQVLAILENLGDRQNLIFPSPDGNYINWGNFTSRAWREILESLPEIDYRKPYQTRHTFITLQGKAGVSAADIAAYCGNSPGIVHSTYTGHSRNLVMKEI